MTELNQDTKQNYDFFTGEESQHLLNVRNALSNMATIAAKEHRANTFQGLKWHPWYEFDLYTGKWDVIPLRCYEFTTKFATERYPDTLQCLSIIEQELGVTIAVAGISRLGPGTIIHPHDGVDDGAEAYTRFHVPVDVTIGSYLKVGNQYKTWQDEVLIFNDAKLHTAANKSERDRAVLLVDVVDPWIEMGAVAKLKEDMVAHYQNVGYFL